MDQRARWVGGTTGGAGPRGGGGPILAAPGIVSGLLAVTAVIFLFQRFGPHVWARRLEIELAFNPLRFSTGLEAGVSPQELAVPVFGHMFLHGGVEHILFNSVWLLVFGAGVARRLGVDFGGAAVRFFRNVVFLVFYFLCGVAGVSAYYVLDPSSPVFLVGASGAISGLMGGAMRFVTPPDATRGQGPHDLTPLTATPVLIVTIVFVAINLMTALGLDSVGARVDIAWEAHLGGYFAGLLLFPIFDRIARLGTRGSRAL